MSSVAFEPDTFYHIYNRGNNKENIFIEEKNYNYFLSKVSHYLLPICNIYAYCLMPNHFHFVLQIKEESSLPSAYLDGNKSLHQPFSNLFNAYAKAINKAYGRMGSLFQEHMGRNVISDHSYLQDVIMYVNLNASKHGFTQGYYKYSSYNALISDKPTHLMRSQVIRLFTDLNNMVHCHKQQKYLNRDKLTVLEADDI